MRLSDLQTGQGADIIKVLGHGGFRRRIMEMGFVRGQRVEVLLNAPLKDPIKYRVMGYEVSLRRSEAAMIEVVADEDILSSADHGTSACTDEGCEKPREVARSKKQINIALVGNPNSGKSSLYNALSGSHEHVGNYGGVTVESKRGSFTHGGYEFIVYDLPGTYALSPYTPEELYVRRHLSENIPDVVVNVVAASNLERNLYLTTELIDIAQEMVVALNMYDELTSSGARLDAGALETLLGVPLVPVVARDGRGLDELLDTIIDIYEHRCIRSRHIHINHGPAVESALGELRGVMSEDFGHFPKHFSRRYLILKFLEGDRDIEKLLSKACPHYEEWLTLRDRLAQRVKKELGEDIETAVTGEKYGFISGALRETFTPAKDDRISTTTAIDAIVTHKLWGFPIFLLLMWLMFELTFKLGQYPMDWIEHGVEWLGRLVGRVMPDGPLHEDGVGREAFADFVDDVADLRAGAVELVDEGEARHAVAVGLPPHGLALRLHARHAVEDDDRAVQHAEAALDLGREVDVAGGVDEVDLVFAPGEGGRGALDRDAALLLVPEEVHDGVAVVDLAHAVLFPAVIEDALGGGGLAGVDMGDDADVADAPEGHALILGHARAAFPSWSGGRENRRGAPRGSNAIGGGRHGQGKSPFSGSGDGPPPARLRRVRDAGRMVRRASRPGPSAGPARQRGPDAERAVPVKAHFSGEPIG